MNLTYLKAALISCGVFCGSMASAVTFTFDSAVDMTSNFAIDVLAGDTGTQWRPGYTASGPFPASDGGYVHFNFFNDSNSLQFLSGPVTLNSFDISSQHSFGGSGVNNADGGNGLYNLILYDNGLNELYNQTLTIAAGGVWETLTFNIPNVHTIWIEGPGLTASQGWWPNIDNIVADEAATVPVPASILLLGGALGALGLRRKSRKAG